MKKLLSSLVQACPPLYRQINRLRRYRLHKPNLRLRCELLGTSYGGWCVPMNFLRPTSIAYTVGVGEDISFDLELVRKYGCNVFAFDPTPIAVEFMERAVLPERLVFVPVGLGPSDGRASFFTAQIEGCRSFSQVVDPKEGMASQIACEVLTLKSIKHRLQHESVDLVKMDIEGFEYDVIDEMMSSGTKPKCLLVEFHHQVYGISPERTRKSVASLLANGYSIFWVSELGREYGFFRVSSEPRAESMATYN
jgi:FkbM family methyltransferase